MFISRWSKPVERAKLLGDGIRITPRQSPSLHSILVEAAARVGVPCPELFIKQDPTFSAYTMGTNEDHVIVMHSGLFDAGEPDELQFILGHELGHIRNHHVTNMTIARFLANGVSGIVEVLALPLEVLAAPLVVALDAWSREAEKTADRAGYLATLSPDASLRALVLLAAGSRKLMSEMNLSEYLSQREGLNTAQAKLHLWLGGYDHPHLDCYPKDERTIWRSAAALGGRSKDVLWLGTRQHKMSGVRERRPVFLQILWIRVVRHFGYLQRMFHARVIGGLAYPWTAT
jgi:Zn-dependent protease with chaperone function